MGCSPLSFLEKLLALPDDILVFPAHFRRLDEANENQLFCRTLAELKKMNKGLLMAQKSLEEFSQYIVDNIPQFPQEYLDIKRVNIGLLKPTKEQAAELELGKNVCAIG